MKIERTEGFSRHSNKGFVQFLFISKGSISEKENNLASKHDEHN